MAKTEGALRMSGMNSGFDTESIVKAMTASTKLKMTKAQRSVLGIEAKQTAYRGVITGLTTLKDKYFNILNRKSYIMGSSLYGQFKTKLSMAGEDKVPAGVTVSTNDMATAGKYDIEVIKAATQANFTTDSYGSAATIDLSAMNDPTATYSTTISVGDVTKTISVSGNTDVTALTNSINDKLKEFGTSNDGKGIVTIDGAGKITTTNKKGVTISNISKLDATGKLTWVPADLKSGNNSFYIQTADGKKAISYQSLSADHFKDIFEADGITVKADADKTLVKLYDEIKTDMYNSDVKTEYDAWRKGIDDTEEALYNQKLASGEISDVKGEANYKTLATFKKEYEDPREVALYEEQLGFAKQAHYDTAYDKAFNVEKKAAYNKALAEDKLGVGSDGQTIKIEEWDGYTKAEFDASTKYTDFRKKYYGTADGNPDGDYTKGTQLDPDMYKKITYDEKVAFKDVQYIKTNPTFEDFQKTVTADEAVKHFNVSAINKALDGVTLTDGSTISVDTTGYDVGNIDISIKDKNGNAVDFALIGKTGSTNDLGLTADATKTFSLSIATKLSDLGLKADSHGRYNFNINGTDFSLGESTTIKDMMKTINDSKAGVTVSFSALTNSFEIKAKEYGKDATITFGTGDAGDKEGLLKELGFATSATNDIKTGMNLELKVDGISVEAKENTYEINGATFTFTKASEGIKFSAEISADHEPAKEAIKSFIEDYNKVIDLVFSATDEKPNKDYYFLTDDDREEMELSDKQEEKWEIAAKKGILYNDPTVLGVMSDLRSTLFKSIAGSDGKQFGLYSMGISTASDWKDHGKLIISDEEKFNQAFTSNSFDVAKLFSDTKEGIMVEFGKGLDAAVKTTGARADKGSLVRLAGTASGTSATDNSMFDQITALNKQIKLFEFRYKEQEDRYWKIFSSMETQLGNLNSQNSYISQMLNMK